VDSDDLKRLVRNIPDFPKPSILFRDFTPLLLDPAAVRAAVDAIAAPFRSSGIQRVLGIESRGFIFGAPVALALGAGFAPVRKAGKLPYDKFTASYALEYGEDRVELHVDAVSPGQRVLVVDDVIATGGTASAAVKLARMAGGEVLGASFLIELAALGGVRLLDVPCFAVIRY